MKGETLKSSGPAHVVGKISHRAPTGPKHVLDKLSHRATLAQRHRTQLISSGGAITRKRQSHAGGKKVTFYSKNSVPTHALEKLSHRAEDSLAQCKFWEGSRIAKSWHCAIARKWPALAGQQIARGNLTRGKGTSYFATKKWASTRIGQAHASRSKCTGPK